MRILLLYTMFILLPVLLIYGNSGINYAYSLNYTYYDKKFKLKPVNEGPAPIYYDWRTKDAVSPVKNQMACNACWAFSAVANVESQVKIHFNRKDLLSEQFLINCDGGRAGCGPQGLLDTYGRIVNKLGGIVRDRDYEPYRGRLMSCQWDGVPKPQPVIGYRRVPPNTDAIKEFIYRYGPVSAAINSASMDNYKGGIDEPREDQCPPENLNHAVLIVGYNVYVDPNGTKFPYWIIKNSWGEEWGDNGYYYLTMRGNACGITSDVSISIVV